jgi:hypothetical protein
MGKMMDNVMPNNLTQNANLMIKMNSRKFWYTLHTVCNHLCALPKDQHQNLAEKQHVSAEISKITIAFYEQRNT